MVADVISAAAACADGAGVSTVDGAKMWKNIIALIFLVNYELAAMHNVTANSLFARSESKKEKRDGRVLAHSVATMKMQHNSRCVVN